MQKTKKDRQNERGSALLLVLGILSLVLIMGMSFVFTARTERQVAQANSSQMSAKLIAQSALNRVISDMGYYFRDDDDKPLAYPSVELTDDSEPITFGLQTAPGSDKGMQLCAISKNLHIGTIEDEEQDHFNDLLHLETFDETNDVYYESLPQVTLIEKVSGKETFVQPITVTYKNADDKTCTDVIGRYGYIILEEGSKIDVNSALSFSGKVPFAPLVGDIYNNLEIKDVVDNFSRIASPYDEVTETYDESDSQDYVYYIALNNSGNYEKDVTNGSSVEGENTVRLGLSMEEIQLKKKFWDKLPDGSSKVKKAPWMSYAHLSNALGKKDFTKESFNYTFFSGEDIEAFWDADEKVERNRFDLTGFTASEETGDVKYSERMENNFWELTSSEQSNLQENAKKKMEQLTGASGSSKRAEFWKELTDGELAVYFDGKKKGFWYELKADGTVDTTTPKEDTEEYGGIPWLDKMKDDDDKSVSDQVAANLIDYSDKDNIATTNFDVNIKGNKTEGFEFKFKDPDHPYCGNERVPYANEMLLRVLTQQSIGADDKVTLKMSMEAQVELVNIYCNCENQTTGDCESVSDKLHLQVLVIGQFKLRKTERNYIPDGNGGVIPGEEVNAYYNPDTKNWETEDSDSNWAWFGGNNGFISLKAGNKIPQQFHLGYKVMDLQNSDDILDDVEAQDGTEAGVIQRAYSIKYRICQMVIVVYEGDELKNDSLCDVVFTPKQDKYFEDIDWISLSTPKEQEILNMQANDPRCNTIAIKNGSEWNDNYWLIKKYPETIEHTLGDDESDLIGANNTNFESKVADLKNKPDDKDWEHHVTFEGSKTRTFSTAYIRNAPMQSLWELGAIHRGAPFQTINLKKFTEPKEASGKYGDGDAAILDYVKIGPLRFAKGRVNANTRNLGAIDLLLKDITEETYDGGDLPTVDGDADAVSWNIDINEDDLMDPDKYKTSFNRGVMANLLFDMLDSDVKTDRDAEALIGKTAGLLTTRLDTYSVYIVAEALREMRDIPDDTTYDAIKDTLINPVKVTHVIRADEDYNSSTASYRPAGTKTSYCSIAGVQRMLVHLVRDAWRNEIKVERVQYLEK